MHDFSDLMARSAGLRPRARYSGWNGESFTADSGRHVIVYERGTYEQSDS